MGSGVEVLMGSGVEVLMGSGVEADGIKAVFQ